MTDRCPNCGAIPPGGANFCPRCGTSFGTARDPDQDARPPSGFFDVSFRNAIKIGAGLAIGVGLVVTVLYSIVVILFALSLALGGR